MNELTYLKRRMILDLNRRLGAEVVQDLRLQPASGEAARRAPRRGE
jgi:hypothetical protein